jgi:hypothetical protein
MPENHGKIPKPPAISWLMNIGLAILPWQSGVIPGSGGFDGK